MLNTLSPGPMDGTGIVTAANSRGITKILAFSTDPDYDIRIRELLRELFPEFYNFDRKEKWQTLWGLLREIRNGHYDLVVMEGTGTAGGIAAILGRLLYGAKYIFSSGDAVAPFLAMKWPAGRFLLNLYE